ncbi:hypothetical protein AYO42_00815 [Rhizomicrobium sp. SCGC AG-212-E05]|nr:hypothetical protein AYO42_00815 [Rhizomicrobium sp. SCGC AG-212-E05]
MAVETIKIRAREELIRLTANDLRQDFGTLNEKQQSIATAKFYIREIHNALRTQIAEEELLEGIVDGANDLGCDFIHRDDGRVLIIQAKYRKASGQEKPEDISYFQSILKRMRDPGLRPNKYLREILGEIDWGSDSFNLVYIAFSKIDGQARTISVQQPTYPNDVDEIERRCEWHFLDENELNVELRGARNLQAGISQKEIKLYPIGQKGQRGTPSIIELNAGSHKSFIMALDARQLIKAYEELGRDSIFSLNIRNFIGNTSTNSKIIETAEADAENFFLFNNGISCLASRVIPTTECLSVVGLQVINGAQTIKALVILDNQYKRARKSLWDATPPCVLVRITEVAENYGPSAKIREQITQYNNTQNTIKISDFRSNDEVQKNLVRQFSEISRGGKKVSYQPKRTDKSPPNSEVVKMEEYSKSIYAFLHNPVSFSGSTSFLFNTEKGGGYSEVFGDGLKIWEQMPDDEFKLRAGIYWLAQEFGTRLRTLRDSESDPDSKAALERKWLLVFAASVVFKYHYGDAWKHQVRKLYKGDWKLDDGKKGDVITKIYEAARVGVITSYKNSKKFNSKFVHRNWMRGKETPADIEETLRTTVLPILQKIGDIPS